MTATHRPGGDAAPQCRRAAPQPGLRLTGLLTLPMVWLVVVYLGRSALLFVTAFWTDRRLHRPGGP